MVVTTKIKVRGYHLDMYRHVNNARYLEFLEEGRWAFFEKSSHFDRWPKGVGFFVVNINISYRQPTRAGDILEIRTRLSRLGVKSGIIHQEIILQGTQSVIVEADVTFAIVDRKTQKALPLAGNLLDFFKSLADTKDFSTTIVS